MAAVDRRGRSWRAGSLFGLFIVRKPTELLDSLVRWPVLASEGNVAAGDRAGRAAQRIRRSARVEICESISAGTKFAR